MLALAATSADAAFPGEDGKIAFSKYNDRQGVSGVFAIAPEGGTQTRLGPEDAYSPSWSDDGEQVVFVASSGESEMEYSEDIYVMNADGSNVRQVTDTRAYESSPLVLPRRGDHSLRTVQQQERLRHIHHKA